MMNVALKKWAVFISVNIKSLNGLAIGLGKLILQGDKMQFEKALTFNSFKDLSNYWARKGITRMDDKRLKNFRLVSSNNLEKFVVVTRKKK